MLTPQSTGSVARIVVQVLSIPYSASHLSVDKELK